MAGRHTRIESKGRRDFLIIACEVYTDVAHPANRNEEGAKIAIDAYRSSS
jgi:hypothetical protein